jgi:PAS domain S-box-containing protein
MWLNARRIPEQKVEKGRILFAIEGVPEKEQRMSGKNDSDSGKSAAWQKLRKRAEDDLKKSEQEKTAILDSLMEHVVYHSPEMRILWANRAACESAHMKREDLLGRNCHEIWEGRQSPCQGCPVIAAQKTGQPQTLEKMTPDGRWWYIQVHLIRDGNGPVAGTAEIALDITERKRAEAAIRKARDELEIKVAERTDELATANEQLRQEIEVRKKAQKKLQASETLLSKTFDALQDLVIVIDRDFKVVMSNWKHREHLSEKERRERPHCYAVCMGRKTPCEDCHTREVFATGEIKVFEQTNSLDGQTREIQVIPIFDDRKKVAMVVERLRNITERKQAEARIRNLSQQLLKAQENERQMISRELHDRVAQDLSTLKIGLDTLYHNEPTVSPEVQGKILEFSAIIQNSIRTVRDLSYDLRLSGLDDMGLIPALSMYCEEFAEKSGLEVDFRATGLSALKLDFDTEMNLYRLIQEGLNNIRKHAAASRATVRLVGAYPNIILRIEDDGKGFNVEERARTADSEKRMGLRSMAERVSLMQGEMTIEAQPLKGTRIIIKFPFQEKKHGPKENHFDR